MNRQNEFKAGDKVYYPLKSNKIYKLETHTDAHYLLRVVDKDCSAVSFSTCGKLHSYDSIPSIFHATPENCELLSKLYDREFEKPKPRPTPRQVIEHRLARASFAPCLVGDRYHWDVMVLIVCVKDDKDGGTQYIDGVGNIWHDAQLIDDNENEITEIEE